VARNRRVQRRVGRPVVCRASWDSADRVTARQSSAPIQTAEDPFRHRRDETSRRRLTIRQGRAVRRVGGDGGVRAIPASPSQKGLSVMLGWVALLIATAGSLSALIATLPFWPVAHPRLVYGEAAFLLPASLALCQMRARAPQWLASSALITAIALVAVVGWGLGPGPQLQVCTACWGFGCVIASAYLPRRAAALCFGLAGALYLGILALQWRAEFAPQWALYMTSVALPAILTNVLAKRLRTLAAHDPLTGLANRRAIEQLLPAHLSYASRHKRPLSTAALDLDGLKAINDLAGHAAGDQLILAAARGFARALRPYDVLIRTGGDEFVLILPDTSLGEAHFVLQRLRAATPGIAFSAGLVRWAGESVQQLLERADAALYAAKKAGGNQVVATATPGESRAAASAEATRERRRNAS